MDRRNIGRVLVTGAAGFIGRYLVRALLAEGMEVLAFVRERGLPEGLDGERLRVIRGDIGSTKDVEKALSEAQSVCHLAAFIPPDYKSPSYIEKCLRINGLFTLHLAELALRKDVSRFIYFSTASVYGYSEKAVSEDAPLNPAGKAGYYSVSKLIGELYVEQLRSVHALPAVILRVASCYGPGMPDKSVVAHFMRCAKEGLPMMVQNGGSAAYDFVYVCDVAKAAIAALKGGDRGIYNVGSGSRHTVLQLAHAAADTFPEKKAHVEVEPPDNPADKGFSGLSIEKAKKAWGFKPLSLKEGLAEYRKETEKYQ